MSEKKKIFIVEDDQDLCRAWSRLFKIKGYDFIIEQNSEAALENKDYIKNCDIFITDYYLPDSNGVELAKKARELSSAPFILLTGSKEEALVNEAAQVENLHILYKPIRFQALEKKIHNLTGKE